MHFLSGYQNRIRELNCHLARLGDDRAAFNPAIAHTDQALEVFITKKVTPYQHYAERQLAAIKACQGGEADHCSCGG